MSIAVNHYRFRNDDGSESAATWIAALDTNAVVTLAGDFSLRLRFSLADAGIPATVGWGLQYSRNGGAAVTVDNLSACLTGRISANLVDGANTTNQMPVDVPNTYATRPGVTNNVNCTSSIISQTLGDQTEVEWSMNLIAADVAGGDTFDFTLFPRNGTTTIIQFTGNVRLTINPVFSDGGGVGNESLPPLIPPLLSSPLYQRNYLSLPIDSSDKEAGGTAFFGEGDEDLDPNRLLLPGPFPLKPYLQLPITADSETPSLTGQDDSDFWVTMVAPLVAGNFQPLPRGFVNQTEETSETPTTLGPDEDFWRSMVAPVPPSSYQQLPIWVFRGEGELSPGSAPSAVIAVLKKWMSVQQANLWVVCRVAANGVFNLDLLTSSDPDAGTNYIVKQIASTPLAGVDGATAGYTNHVQMSTPWPAVGQLQIYGAAGLLYYADVRIYYKLRHRRR